MKIHTVFITYNRLELTKQAVASYLETVSVPFTWMVVDNKSSDGTREWILEEVSNFSLLNENRYPGFATNSGWLKAPHDATHLHRADNDFSFLPGWCEEVERMFASSKKIAQVGLRTDAEEMHVTSNTGGNCAITKELFDKGLRYDERPWDMYPPGYSEDSFFSPRIQGMGYDWDRVEKPCIESLASGSLDDPYYQESYGVRRIICEHGKLRNLCGRAHAD